DNLIVRDEAANKDVMTFVAGNGRVGIGTSSPSTLLHVAGTITEDSDIRLKENIHTIDSALIKINQIRGVSFDWKDKERNDDHAQLGVIAQEIKEIFPALVFVSDDEMGTLSVNYDGLIAPLIEAVKAQQKQIEALKTENSTLKTDNKQIVDRLDELENLVTGYAKK
ncbi:MAG: tail fiber domain-containing protein, partial [Bacteroidales bacterium]|nr:tail fiber domain-containing protein [Bacteroidales bacterium]